MKEILETNSDLSEVVSNPHVKFLILAIFIVFLRIVWYSYLHAIFSRYLTVPMFRYILRVTRFLLTFVTLASYKISPSFTLWMALSKHIGEFVRRQMFPSGVSKSRPRSSTAKDVSVQPKDSSLQVPSARDTTVPSSSDQVPPEQNATIQDDTSRNMDARRRMTNNSEAKDNGDEKKAKEGKGVTFSDSILLKGKKKKKSMEKKVYRWICQVISTLWTLIILYALYEEIFFSNHQMVAILRRNICIMEAIVFLRQLYRVVRSFPIVYGELTDPVTKDDPVLLLLSTVRFIASTFISFNSYQWNRFSTITFGFSAVCIANFVLLVFDIDFFRNTNSYEKRRRKEMIRRSYSMDL